MKKLIARTTIGLGIVLACPTLADIAIPYVCFILVVQDWLVVLL